MADLITDVFRGISDTRLLKERRVGPSPLNDLIEAYDELTHHNDDLPKIEEDWTGADLKNALSLLESDALLVLVMNYRASVRHVLDPWHYAEDPAIRDLRRLKYWFLKASFITVVVLVLTGIGGVMALAYNDGKLYQNAVSNTYFNTIKMVFELIFMPNKGLQ